MNDNQLITVAGITYSKPTVILLQETGIGTAEYAARTAYDSFGKSENGAVHSLDFLISEDNKQPKHVFTNTIHTINSIEHSNLLDDLAWTYFHHSVLEHASLTYLIKGTSRGVLQELVRHRVASPTVRSTRYTMSSVINAFIASQYAENNIEFFISKILEFNMFVVQGSAEILEASQLYYKLEHQLNVLSKAEFYKLAIAKSSLEDNLWLFTPNEIDVFNMLQAGKAKRNIGDAFKWCVTDNFKTDLVFTINLRSLKNLLTLRDSGAAYFLIRELAQAMKVATPSKYLDLIIKAK